MSNTSPIMNNQSPKKIGITGQKGFVGSHLYNTLGLFPEEFERVEFQKEYFEDTDKLDEFVSQCDVIVHLAALNRHDSEQFIYEMNVGLAQKLVDSLKRTNSKAHVLISSSTQEERDNLYGKSKREGRQAIVNWAQENGGNVTGLIIPNVFGAFGKPYYNSFIATFCYQLTHGETPTIATDGEVKLIYVQELVYTIINEIRSEKSNPELLIEPTSTKKVSEVLSLLNDYKTRYFDGGEIPVLNNQFEHNLFNTYRSYIDHKTHYPVKFVQHTDPRGAFVEVIRLGIGGQCSFSTTVPGITRGNHYHTRKIERFAVIKGKALIQLRKIDTDETLDFYLDGTEPAYVDMPIWYTHNIKNIGEEDLYTIFWIDEPFNPEDADTYFLEV
ncbi:polysaccharide biosynthesis C-terminal domain-containing protein [Chryseobacterium fistulae]|uniref:UDP-2-acetamido-2,6-beta-L-arabino-hexul-4-ose reductase n=1 Tax=Chryseobacterium fistulae TaxID=2675058 RepID=A0A6N4XR17_9FLAO|nr:NAD-dependent epimerase/dehydratase family protein [Chryseobacterium fistulae]CAA7386192.1 UDP-2-acetamido-2,6-beta-L-arabino-hexul-4-ose reductase [Chryseobacterium fistulae]